MQRQDQPGRFKRQRRVAEILGAEFGETEFVFSGHFPQEFKIDFKRNCLGLFQQFGRRWLFELQQHVLDLDLGAFAARHVHVISLARLREHRADLEIAGFFKK